MAVPVVPEFIPHDNTDIYNSIRKNASIDYQRRVPDATKANVQSLLLNVMNYRPTQNEFIDALVNRIGLEIYKSVIWTNPLAKFKRGMLNFGDTIEEINVGLLKAKLYQTDREYLESDIFGVEVADVQTRFHKISRQEFYKISINETLLRRAFLEDYGLSGFVTNLMNAPSTSDNFDEFLLTTSLFNEYYKASGFFKVNVPDVSLPTSTQTDAQYMLRRLREFSSILAFPSAHYNASGMPVAATPDELELFITPEANSGIDVEALAGAFNMEKADIPNRTTVIPNEYFGIPGLQAILTSRDFFVIADTFIDTTSAMNPVGLNTNYFLHHHEVISASPFVPAILFTTEAGDVITLVNTPVSGVQPLTATDPAGNAVTQFVRGSSYQLVSEAITNPTGGYNDSVRFELVGTQSPRTYLVAQTGSLHISVDEPSESVTINVVAVDTGASGNAQIGVTSTWPIVGDLLILWPDPTVIPDSNQNALLEVTPKAVPAAPTSGTNKNKVTIPTSKGIDYKDGTTVVSGQTITLTANKTITAVPQAGYELASGAVSSWNLVYTP